MAKAARFAAGGARQPPPQPQRDEKILAYWNGLTIRGFGHGRFGLRPPAMAGPPLSPPSTTIVKLMDQDGTLFHAWATGGRGPQGFADDYVHMAEAALQLYEFTGDKRFAERPRPGLITLDNRFWDETRGGYHLTASDAEQMIIRTRVIYDQPGPSANGAMIGPC